MTCVATTDPKRHVGAVRLVPVLPGEEVPMCWLHENDWRGKTGMFVWGRNTGPMVERMLRMAKEQDESVIENKK